MKKYILLSFVLFVVLVIGGWAWRFYTAPIEGRVGAQETIQSKETRLASYNHFFDLYAAIKSYDTMLKAQEQELNQVTSDGAKERILANISGIKGQKARAIQQYNADARKSYTIGQFRDWQLPYQIEE